jgi:hypothetical protein
MNSLIPSSTLRGVSRRRFIQSSACLTLGALVAGRSLGQVVASGGKIALVVNPSDPLVASVPAVWAMGELERALVSQGAVVRRVAACADSAPDEFCVVIAGMSSPPARESLQSRGLTAASGPESLCLVRTQAGGRSGLLAAGTDERGLVYALTELADRVSSLATGRAALEFAEPVVESPASRIRSILRGFSSEVEDKEWFYDRDYWRSYLTMLVSCRVNRLNFALGMGYNSVEHVTDGYLVFPYPFFVEVPGRVVRAHGLADDERVRNLATLKFIAKECARRGLLFQLGIWTLAYQWMNSPRATYAIEGLTDATHAAYCRDALALILREVPQITGVTFRVHNESGIPKGEEDFWKIQFSAIQDCGRRVEIDLHAKNMTPETLQTALATGQPVCISPKFCGEHLGLPYPPASIRQREMSPANQLFDSGQGMLAGDRLFTRYGYADTLAENRTWDVVFRIWPGTQRFLLNGDPATFAGYGRNAAFCGAAGIELSEPLHFKGRRGSGLPGGRLAYTDKSLEPQYDFEKYRYTYLLWGRLGYNPATNPEIWRRALRQEFGGAAPAIEQALGPASRVLPLFTLAHGPSADCASYWPEIYLNMPMASQNLSQPYGDTRLPKRFGNVSSFDPQLFQSPDECGDALLAGTAAGKYSPLEVAQWLTDMGGAAGDNIALARQQLGARATLPAFRRIEEDVLIQRGLALFFAGKLRAGVIWRIYTATGSRPAGEAAIAYYGEARDSWAAMAERAEGVYRRNITYGPDHISGHWADRIAAFDADLADLRQRLVSPVTPTTAIDGAAVTRALRIATSRPSRPSVVVEHTPAATLRADQPLAIAVRVAGLPRRVTLHYRHVDQAERWQSLVLISAHDAFHGAIPADYTNHRFALQYYFEVETGPSEATLFPPFAADLANRPYFVVRHLG